MLRNNTGGDAVLNINLSNVIAPSFYEVHKDIKENKYTHYWLDGGR